MDEETKTYLDAAFDRLVGRMNNIEERNLLRSQANADIVSARLSAVESRIGSLEQRMAGIETIAARFSTDSLLLTAQIEAAHRRLNKIEQGH